MLKIRRPLGRLIFNMGIAIPGKTVFLIETAPSIHSATADSILIVLEEIYTKISLIYWTTLEDTSFWKRKCPRIFKGLNNNELWFVPFISHLLTQIKTVKQNCWFNWIKTQHIIDCHNKLLRHNNDICKKYKYILYQQSISHLTHMAAVCLLCIF